MNRSIRCPHGFCLETIGCEQCGTKASKAASRAPVHSKPKGKRGHYQKSRQLRLAAERERQSG